ncbi:uncharacterized protein B0H64DRAFT_427037 [Chaetomium fimeti]|uniref:Uncharacterized protein n=1 Tax=Chaetomium fimeti TaxID=1854472 RepID=A0AAE0H7J7_9PEZI|nr:hypothetical protein B0H64DRAFT_427037 [Chaetomium fimeti]
MAVLKTLPLLYLALSVLCSGVLAGKSGHLGTRAPLNQRGVGTCHIEGWIPACPGAFACIPPGGVCCSDGASYALGPETCPEGTTPLPAPGFSPGSGGNHGSDSAGDGAGPEAHSHDASAPSTTAPPHPHPDPLGPDVGPDFLGFGSNWYTFSMTFHFLSHWYSLVDHTSSVLVSGEILSCSTVSVSATDAAQASAIFNSISASAALAAPTETQTLLPVPKETQAALAPPVETQAPAAPPPPIDAVGSLAPVIPAVSPTPPVSLAPAATGGWKQPTNGTVGTAKPLPTAVVTAGAARFRELGGAVVGVVAFALGRMVLL